VFGASWKSIYFNGSSSLAEAKLRLGRSFQGMKIYSEYDKYKYILTGRNPDTLHQIDKS